MLWKPTGRLAEALARRPCCASVSMRLFPRFAVKTHRDLSMSTATLGETETRRGGCDVDVTAVRPHEPREACEVGF